MWNDHLVDLPSGSQEILGTLERSLILRKFNREHLGMEDLSANIDMAAIIGVGTRMHKPTSDIYPVHDFIPSYWRRVVRIFEVCGPVLVKYFGLNISEAMALPVWQWYEIEKQAKMIYEKQEPDPNLKMVKLLEQFLEAMTLRGGE